MPSFETLLFSFGVGLGVFASGVHKLEVKRLNQLLEQSQAELETLKLELERRKSPLRTNRSESATVSDIVHLLALQRRAVCAGEFTVGVT